MHDRLSVSPCRGARWSAAALGCALGLITISLSWAGPESDPSALGHQAGTSVPGESAGAPAHAPREHRGPRGVVNLAFAGDTHFQDHLAALLDHPHGALGPITRSLKDADLTMVNLESALAVGGAPDPKELEVPSNRYWFRTPPRALGVLAAAGVDVVTMANNHGADYGAGGLAETLRARRHTPVQVVGVGRNRRAAFTPYRITIRGTRIAVLGADSSPREGMSPTWAAGRTTAGIAAAHSPHPLALLRAVRAAADTADVVVVYLHWGTELRACPDPLQLALARGLAKAGADVVVGSHAHVLLGSGWLDDTYVDYGLGNFLWYHDHEPETGVLRVTVRDGEVADGRFVPARIQRDGRPLPLSGSARQSQVAAWRHLRECTGLLAERLDPARPGFTASSRRIGPALAHRMRFSHRSG